MPALLTRASMASNGTTQAAADTRGRERCAGIVTVGDSVEVVSTTLTGSPASAPTNSSIVLKRSSGSSSRAPSSALSIGTGTSGRASRTLGTGLVNRCATIAAAVGPVNGVAPVSIS